MTPIRCCIRASLLCAVVAFGAITTLPSLARELMLIADDEKITWDDTGKPVYMAPGKDHVLVVDIGGDPTAPTMVANLPLMNTIFGPPTNLQVTPDGKLALVANSMDYVADGASWKPAPVVALKIVGKKITRSNEVEVRGLPGHPAAMRGRAR